MTRRFRSWAPVPAAVCLLAICLVGPFQIYASQHAYSVRLSLGSSWQGRNDVQIPNTNEGTRFSLEEAAGEGPATLERLEINWSINERHGLRVLLAPLSLNETVLFDEPIRFAGETFAAGQSTEVTYRFNSWRLGYHYTVRDSGPIRLRIGATAKIRDAEIRLQQGETESFDDDVGFVPLLYLEGRYRLSDRWVVAADLDGLAGGPGRAIDLGARVGYVISPRWQVGAEARVLDGGADTDEVYNFARFNSAAIVIGAVF